MGRFAAVVSRRNVDASKILQRMLRVIPPNIDDTLGVATEDGVIYGGELDIPHSKTIMGYSMTKILPRDPPQPIVQNDESIIFEGRLWDAPDNPNVHRAADELRGDPETGMRRLIEDSQGSFAVLASTDGALFCGRDPVGAIPIYYGENNEITAIASNRKMLWATGLEASALHPGHMLRVSDSGLAQELIRVLTQPPIRQVTMEATTRELEKLLTGAIDSRTRGLFRASLGFSGGIDSSLIAHYLDDSGIKTELLCVGIEGTKEFESAESAAETLDLPLRIEAFSLEDVENELDAVLWSIEEANPVQASIALPLYWAARISSKVGIRVFFSGNGSDELFGGYSRHAKEYRESGEAVKEMIFRDVTDSHKVNYERDHKVFMDHGVELRLPFADQRLIEWGLTISPSLKLSNDPHSPRKLVLRNLAKKLGFPERLAMKRKKAIQYSTGVNGALKKLAKRESKSLGGFLSDRFEKLKEKHLGGG